MKILTLAVSLLLSCTCAFSQHNHFVYIQSDNKQPFYIKLSDKLYSSSSAGYAIVPKLQKGDYKFLIGFPKSEWPQQTMDITVNADAGYMLKNFGDKGWGLFNIQTMAVTMASTGTPATPAAAAVVKKDDFSNTLGAVVNVPLTVSADTVKAEVPVVTNTVVTVAETKPIASGKPLTGIKILNTQKDTEGTSMVYLDNGGGNMDTIRVFIPIDKHLEIQPSVIPVVKKEAKEEEKKEVTKEEKKEEKKEMAKPAARFLDIELGNPNAGTDTVAQKKEVVTVVAKPVTQSTVPVADLKPLMINSDCKEMASDEDFLKIRKKMAAESNDEDMIAAAKKMFRQKCYATQQVKNLSVLFLKDAGKYAFFDAAYPHISDSNNFSKLEAELTEPYYITRFKAMIRN